MDTVEIEIPISEYDIEEFKELVFSKGKSFSWNFESDIEGVSVQVTFVRDFVRDIDT